MTRKDYSITYCKEIEKIVDKFNSTGGDGVFANETLFISALKESGVSADIKKIRAAIVAHKNDKLNAENTNIYFELEDVCREVARLCFGDETIYKEPGYVLFEVNWVTLEDGSYLAEISSNGDIDYDEE